MDMNPYAESTRRRHRWCKRLWKHLRPQVSHPSKIITILSLHYVPSSTLTYARTMASLFPKETRNKLWKMTMEKVQQMDALQEKKQAKPLKLDQVIYLMEKSGNALLSAQFLLVWITLSRHGDVPRMKIRATKQINAKMSKVSVRLPVFKSDRTGKRMASKAFPFPNTLMPALSHIIKKPIPSYRIIAFMNHHLPGFSLHSFRRGSMAFMSKVLKVPEKKIYLLSLHAQKDDPILARLYLNHLPFDTYESRQQQKLSHMMLMKVFKSSKLLARHNM